MVSPRHYLAAWHIASWFPFCAGNDKAIFLDRNNVVHYGRSLQCTNAGNDIAVGILDADLPASVGFLPVLPMNYTNYVSATNWVQGIGANQDYLVFSQPILLNAGSAAFWTPTASVRFGLSTNWSRSTRMGDSSFPERLLIRNQLVLVSCNSGIGGGANYAQSADTINSWMHYLSTNNNAGSDYQLTPVALRSSAVSK